VLRLGAEAPRAGCNAGYLSTGASYLAPKCPVKADLKSDIANAGISAQNHLAMIVLIPLDGRCSIILVSF